MKKNIIEVIKENRKAIVKKALIIGGTVGGLAIVALAVAKTKGASEDIYETAFEETKDETTDSE